MAGETNTGPAPIENAGETPPAEQTRSRSGVARLYSIATAFGDWLLHSLKSGAFWLGLLVMGVAVYVFDIAFDDTRLELKQDDIALAWSAGISRLGIQPVYPPQEDLRVGDIWAVVSGYEDTPVLAKGVRLGRIDLRAEIAMDNADRPIFPTTESAKPSEGFRDLKRTQLKPPTQKPEEKTESLITTAITAFPAFTVSHSARSSGIAGLGRFGFGGSRKAEEIEQVRIKEVETYGAPVWQSYGRLVAWCLQKETKDICADDRIVRNLLAFSVNKNVLDQKEGKHTTRITLHLITRVFLTREIDSRRWVVDSRGAKVEVKSEAPLAPPPAGSTISATPDPAESGKAQLSSLISDKSEVGLSGVFQRPLVFGFRSLSIELKPSSPIAASP